MCMEKRNTNGLGASDVDQTRRPSNTQTDPANDASRFNKKWNVDHKDALQINA